MSQAPKSVQNTLRRGEDRSTSSGGNERGKDVRTSNIVAAKGMMTNNNHITDFNFTSDHVHVASHVVKLSQLQKMHFML